jgi:hypothetical protein
MGEKGPLLDFIPFFLYIIAEGINGRLENAGPHHMP